MQKTREQEILDTLTRVRQLAADVEHLDALASDAKAEAREFRRASYRLEKERQALIATLASEQSVLNAQALQAQAAKDREEAAKLKAELQAKLAELDKTQDVIDGT